MAGSINGVAVHGTLRHRPGDLQAFDGTLTVGDNDGPTLLAMMTAGAPIIYTGDALKNGQTVKIVIPVLINVRSGTAATVVEVKSAGAPITG